MKNDGRYRVAIRIESTGSKLIVARRKDEDLARAVANKVAAGLPSGTVAEVWCGIGRSSSRLYIVGSEEDGI